MLTKMIETLKKNPRTIVFYRLVIIDHRHRKLIQISIWIPHGFQKQAGIDHWNNNDRHDYDDQNLVVP